MSVLAVLVDIAWQPRTMHNGIILRPIPPRNLSATEPALKISDSDAPVFEKARISRIEIRFQLLSFDRFHFKCFTPPEFSQSNGSSRPIQHNQHPYPAYRNPHIKPPKCISSSKEITGWKSLDSRDVWPSSSLSLPTSRVLITKCDAAQCSDTGRRIYGEANRATRREFYITISRSKVTTQTLPKSD